MALKVLVTDVVAESGLEYLRDKALEVDVMLGLSTEEIIPIISRYDALIVRSRTKVTRELINAAANLKIIGRAGLSVENIDVDAATERGIIVCNVPESNLTSAAELTMCLMLMCARKAAQAYQSMHEHKWDQASFTGIEVCGKTLLILGLGRVGGMVAQRARAFGMNVIAYDPYCNAERASQLGVKLCHTLNDALPQADFITVHIPKTEETTGMIGPKEFAIMKTGVILLNVSYGGIYNVKSMSDFIAAGKIASVGIDVFETEPCLDSPLHEFPQAVLLPHLGAETLDARERCSSAIAEYIFAGLRGSIVPTAVNLSQVPPDVIDSVGPYIIACETVGAIMSQLSSEIPSVLSLTAAGKLANCDTSSLMAASLKGLLSSREVEHITTANYETMARVHGIALEPSTSGSRSAYTSLARIGAGDMNISVIVPESGKGMRIVSFLDYEIDITPARNSLIFEYPDAPGRIGVIGTILGNAGINITTMQIGTKPAEDLALVYLNVGGVVPPEVLDEIAEHIDLKNMWQIAL